MAQQSRIKKRKYFLMAADQGIKIIAKGMIVYARPNGEKGPRLGFTVTKKVGNAVVRNRLRRRLREVVRLSPNVDRVGPYDIVVIGRQSAVEKQFSLLQDDFAFVLRQIRKIFKAKEAAKKAATVPPESCVSGTESAQSDEEVPLTESVLIDERPPCDASR